MSTFGLIEYSDANPQVKAVYDDIMATRKTDYINNFWKAIAHDPALLKRTWEDLKAIMGPGALDPLPRNFCTSPSASPTIASTAFIPTPLPLRQRHDPGNIQGTSAGHRHGQRNQQARLRLPGRHRCPLSAAAPSAKIIHVPPRTAVTNPAHISTVVPKYYRPTSCTTPTMVTQQGSPVLTGLSIQYLSKWVLYGTYFKRTGSGARRQPQRPSSSSGAPATCSAGNSRYRERRSHRRWLR